MEVFAWVLHQGNPSLEEEPSVKFAFKHGKSLKILLSFASVEMFPSRYT